MKLLFKQRLFSWFDSYDIYDEAGNTVYVVKGQFSWGHKLAIYDAYGNEIKDEEDSNADGIIDYVYNTNWMILV